MSDPIRLQGAVLHEELARRRPELVAAVVASVGELVPAYGGLPREQLVDEFAGVVEVAVRLFAEVLRTGEMPADPELQVLGEAAGRRAEEGIALSDLLATYHFGVSLVMDRLTDGAAPDDAADLVRIQRLLLAFLARVMSVAATGYLAASQESLRESHDARKALLDALLEGGDAAGVAARAGLELPASYLVLALAIGPHADEAAPRVDPAVAARRKLRRFRHQLDLTAPYALASLSAAGGVVLLPARAGGGGTAAETLVGDLARAAGAPVLAAAEAAAPDGVATAVGLTREVLEIARRGGRSEGVVTLDDVLLRYQLSRPSAATARLVERLEPLRGHPEVLRTLRHFVLDDELNRRRTARRLGVHPNTVDNRLRRVQALTGLDTSRPADVQQLMAGLLQLAE
ncbi:PucR family transcriptional regulator [Nocardioides daeguensis]|uniref:Helix-turn-helix domain-containing protein n=1 Tax=Nocardioides daeguensis TaxID=908359 RepID=A0ABP6V7N5_9ACTN|nr:PucR family transcriptional regulator [Nocardioides daeguensis]MBV6726547.1 helix-turn-helix domain-containing protein [Nocardioides daeguensis]MCR1772390.1 helix-turn-helix domain-containing protein [Nocardioides daeguensis]